MERRRLLVSVLVFIGLVSAGAAEWSSVKSDENIEHTGRFNIYKDQDGTYWHPYGKDEPTYLQTTSSGYNWSEGFEITPSNIDYKDRFGQIYQTSDGTYWYAASSGSWAPNPDTIFYQNSTSGKNWSQAYTAIEGVVLHFDFLIDSSDTFRIVTELENDGWHIFRSDDMSNWEKKALNIDARKADMAQAGPDNYRLFYSPSRSGPIYMKSSSNGWDWSGKTKILDLDEQTRLMSVKYHPDAGYIVLFGWKSGSSQEVAYMTSTNGDNWNTPQQVTSNDQKDGGARILKAADDKWVIYWGNQYYVVGDSLSEGPYGAITSGSDNFSDLDAPNVSISISPENPLDNETVEFSTSAYDNVKVENLSIVVDGSRKKTCQSSSCSYTGGPYKVNTEHSYKATAYDNSSNYAETNKQSFNVAKAEKEDNTPPQVSIELAKETAQVNGSIMIECSATDTSGIRESSLEIATPSKNFTLSTACPYNLTRIDSAGRYTVVYRAKDQNSNSAEAAEVFIAEEPETTPAKTKTKSNEEKAKQQNKPVQPSQRQNSSRSAEQNNTGETNKTEKIEKLEEKVEEQEKEINRLNSQVKALSKMVDKIINFLPF